MACIDNVVQAEVAKMPFLGLLRHMVISVHQRIGEGYGVCPDLVIALVMGEGLLVPESALLRTGVRNLAFRVRPGNRFEPVDVTLGPYQFNERFQVLAGLSEGDEIVTSAGFLIDAESRLKSATSAMSGHQHGGSTSPQQTTQPPKVGQDKMPAKGHEHHHHDK